MRAVFCVRALFDDCKPRRLADCLWAFHTLLNVYLKILVYYVDVLKDVLLVITFKGIMVSVEGFIMAQFVAMVAFVSAAQFANVARLVTSRTFKSMDADKKLESVVLAPFMPGITMCLEKRAEYVERRGPKKEMTVRTQEARKKYESAGTTASAPQSRPPSPPPSAWPGGTSSTLRQK